MENPRTPFRCIANSVECDASTDTFRKRTAMRQPVLLTTATLAFCVIVFFARAQQPPEPLLTGLKNPESVVTGGDGRVYVTVIGEFGKDGDGAIMVLDQGQAKVFVKDLDDPKGIAAYQKWLFVADKERVLKIDLKGKVEVFAPAKAFPVPPLFLIDVAVDPESGIVYVSDSGDLKGKGGAVYGIDPKGKVRVVTDPK